MDNLLKKAGLMLAHLELFHRMQALKQLMVLAHAMDERSGRVAMVSGDSISIIGDTTDHSSTFTAKGGAAEAATCYGALVTLKRHEAAEYAVTRDELRALNQSALADIEASPELTAFGETLAKLTEPETPARGRRTLPEELPAAS